MEPTHIEHLGIAVKSLDESIPYYENLLGIKCYSIEEIKDQKVRTAFFKIGQCETFFWDVKPAKTRAGTHRTVFACQLPRLG